MDTPALRLPSPDRLAAQVRDALPLRAEVRWSAETGSTNADVQARLRAADLPPGLEAVVHGAHLQRAGRGRAGRAWQTRAGDALLLSAGFRAHLPMAALPALSIAAGLGACRALAARLPRPEGLKLKWPNDLQWHEAKLAGILVETALLGPVRGGYADVSVVIGMGTNLRGADEMSRHLGREVADWSQAGGSGEAADLVCALVLGWKLALDELARDGLAGLPVAFAPHDALAGRPVRVLDGERVLHEGVACGLDDAGRLRVRTDAGEQRVTVGDVSVRARAAA